jgi:hypothetical protein
VPLDDDDLLDLLVAQRSSTWRFDLLDQNLNDVGELDVSDERVPTIDNDTDRTIKRQLGGVEISAADMAEVNPLSNRVRVSMVLQTGTRLGLGVFVFAGFDRRRYSWGRVPSPAFTDQGIILDQPTAETIAAEPGVLVVDFLSRWLDTFPVQYVLGESDGKVSDKTAAVWPAGTSMLEVLNAVAGFAGFASGYFDGDGVLHYAPAPSLDDPSLNYSLGPSSRVIEGSIVESDSWLDAPNRYLVIDSTKTNEPVIGVFDVPDEAPNSAANTGFVRTEKIDAQGIGSTAQAVALAKRRYQAARTYEWVTFASPPDPRHDTFQTVAFDGLNYRETGWKMTCRDGAAHEHELRRTYA